MAQFGITPDHLPPFEGRSEAARIRTRQALLIRAVAAIGDQLVGDTQPEA